VIGFQKLPKVIALFHCSSQWTDSLLPWVTFNYWQTWCRRLKVNNYCKCIHS